MVREWTPGKTRVRIQLNRDYLTVVAMQGSVDANQFQEFRVSNGTVCRYDADQTGCQPGYHVVIIDRDDGRQVRTQLPTRILTELEAA